MAETKFDLFSFFLTISLANAKNIKLEIDSKDLVSLITTVLESEAVKNFASQMMRRTIPQQTIYNPYHPEDGVETSDSKKEPKSTDTSETKDSKENIKATEPSLENENENFIKEGNKSLEELVVDSTSPDEVKVVPVKDYSVGRNSSRKFGDMDNFHPLQRRFQLKDS